MPPKLTFELKIFPDNQQVAELIKAWFLQNNILNFIEGVVDNLDLDPPYDGSDPGDLYDEYADLKNGLSVFSYQKDELDSLATKLAQEFKSSLTCSVISSETKNWMEGWKESFQPISSRMFYIYPPWCPSSSSKELINIKIDPGMAFGTGQHATTQLCLEILESKPFEGVDASELQVVDIGCGSGILAIACEKIGYGSVQACDIDSDAILATKQNCSTNETLGVIAYKGTTPEILKRQETFHLIIANILAPVLIDLMSDFKLLLKKRGKLMLSGLLVEQKNDVVTRANQFGLHLELELEKDGWLALLFSTPAGGSD